MPPAYEVLLLNTAVPQIQAAQSGDTYVVPRDIAFSAALTLSAGTANGVPYLSSPGKVLTTGSALTFDGTNLVNTSSSVGTPEIAIANSATSAGANARLRIKTGGSGSTTYGDAFIQFTDSLNWNWSIGAGSSTSNNLTFNQYFGLTSNELMRLTSTGLGIGTNNPGQKLDTQAAVTGTYNSTTQQIVARFFNSPADLGSGVNSAFITLQTTPDGGNSNPVARVGVVAESYGSNNGAFVVATRDGSGVSEKMRLDSSGNLGLGVTPSAWSGFKAFDVANVGSLAVFPSFGVALFRNAYYDGSVYRYKISSAASYYDQNSNGVHAWYTAPSGTAGNAISFTQAMTLHASGGLSVGNTTDPGVGNIGLPNGGKLQYSATAYITPEDNISGARVVTPGIFVVATGGTTERARITSSGYFKASDTGTYSNAGLYHEFYQTGNNAGLLVRATNGSYTNDVLTINGDRATTNATYNLINAYNGPVSGQFIVRDSGNVVNTNGSYGTISDAKMKTDIVDAGSQWSDIKALRFRKFKMKNDPSGLVQLGVVAQEVELTSPGLVDEHADKDAEGNDLGTTTKSVKTSVLLMKAAVALQEAMARIEKLEAEVAALKGA